MPIEIIEAIAKGGSKPEALYFALQNQIELDVVCRLAKHDSSSWTLSFGRNEYDIVVSGTGGVRVRKPRTTVSA